MKKNKKTILIISVIFFIKLCSVLYLIYLTKCDNPESFLGIASISGDTFSYITPIDNFLNEGKYYCGTALAGRMPYVGMTYLPFRMFFSKEIALSIVVCLQILIESLAIFYLGKLCKILFHNQKAFWIFIILSCLSLNVTFFDYYILSESFSISFLCFFVYQYYLFLIEGRSRKKLFYSGFFLALAILFKPYLAPIFIFIGIEFLIYEYSKQKKTCIKNVFISTLMVSCSLIILNAPWTIRNYFVFHKFVPFQQDIYAGYGQSKAYFSMRNFVETIGESSVFWDKRSAGCYFLPKDNIPCEFQFPKRIFSANLTIQKIEEAKTDFINYQKYNNDSIENVVVYKFQKLTEIYKREHQFFFYLITPIVLIKKYLFHSGSYYLPISKRSQCYAPHQLLLKIIQSVLYYLCLIAGFVGTFILLRKNKNTFIFVLIPLFLIALFPVYLKMTEFRYFHMAYPFLLIGLVNTLLYLTKSLTFFKRKKNDARI